MQKLFIMSLKGKTFKNWTMDTFYDFEKEIDTRSYSDLALGHEHYSQASLLVCISDLRDLCSSGLLHGSLEEHEKLQ